MSKPFTAYEKRMAPTSTAARYITMTTAAADISFTRKYRRGETGFDRKMSSIPLLRSSVMMPAASTAPIRTQILFMTRSNQTKRKNLRSRRDPPNQDDRPGDGGLSLDAQFTSLSESRDKSLMDSRRTQTKFNPFPEPNYSNFKPFARSDKTTLN